jgi:hypothetical protein
MIENREQNEINREVERRLRDLEGSQRGGLGSIAVGTQDTGQELTAVDTWTDLDCSVTLRTGKRVLMIFSTTVNFLGLTPDFKSAGGFFGIGLDGQNPFDSLDEFFVVANRTFQSQTDGLPNQVITTLPISATIFCPYLVPGEHTFSLWGYGFSTNPGGTQHLVFDDNLVAVLPLGPG